MPCNDWVVGLRPLKCGPIWAVSLPGIVPGLAQLPPSAGDTWNAQQTWPAGAYLAPRPYAFQSRVPSLCPQLYQSLKERCAM